jgi:hypothetical protein
MPVLLLSALLLRSRLATGASSPLVGGLHVALLSLLLAVAAAAAAAIAAEPAVGDARSAATESAGL